MNQYLNVVLEVEKSDVNGTFRTYKLHVPYACPTEEAIAAIDEMREFLVGSLKPAEVADVQTDQVLNESAQ
jgi:hypothetical protein